MSFYEDDQDNPFVVPDQYGQGIQSGAGEYGQPGQPAPRVQPPAHGQPSGQGYGPPGAQYGQPGQTGNSSWFDQGAAAQTFGQPTSYAPNTFLTAQPKSKVPLILTSLVALCLIGGGVAWYLTGAESSDKNQIASPAQTSSQPSTTTQQSSSTEDSSPTSTTSSTTSYTGPSTTLLVSPNTASQTAQLFANRYLSFDGRKGEQTWFASFEPICTSEFATKVSSGFKGWMIGRYADILATTQIESTVDTPDTPGTFDVTAVVTMVEQSTGQTTTQTRRLRVIVKTVNNNFKIGDLRDLDQAS